MQSQTMWKAWLVWSIIVTAAIIHCKNIENGSAKRVQKLLDQLYKNQKYINSLNNSGVSDETPVRKAMKQFIADSETVGKLMHRDDVLDSPYLQQLRVRLQDDHLDIYSVKDDTFHVLKDRDQIYDFMVDTSMDILKELSQNLTKLQHNLKYQPSKKFKEAEQLVKNAILRTTTLFHDLKRRCPIHLRRKLEQSLTSLNSTEGISEANDIIKKIKRLAQKYYKNVDSTQYKIPEPEPVEDKIFRTEEVAAISSEISTIQAKMTFWRYYVPLYPEELETVIKKYKDYLMEVVPKLKKLGQASNINPMNIYAKRVENFAKHIKTQNDLSQACELLDLAMNYDNRNNIRRSLDSYVVTIKMCQSEVESLIDNAKYSDLLFNYLILSEKFKSFMAELKDALWQLAERKHVKGYSKINIELQDILDDIRDTKEDITNPKNKAARQRLINNMENIIQTITEFLNKNPNL